MYPYSTNNNNNKSQPLGTSSRGNYLSRITYYSPAFQEWSCNPIALSHVILNLIDKKFRIYIRVITYRIIDNRYVPPERRGGGRIKKIQRKRKYVGKIDEKITFCARKIQDKFNTLICNLFSDFAANLFTSPVSLTADLEPDRSAYFLIPTFHGEFICERFIYFLLLMEDLFVKHFFSWQNFYCCKCFNLTLIFLFVSILYQCVSLWIQYCFRIGGECYILKRYNHVQRTSIVSSQ